MDGTSCASTSATAADTEHLSRGLYHSGLTHDPLFVIRELIARDGIRAIAVAGYSLGGNLDAQAGRRPRRRGPAGAQSGVRRVADDGSRGVRAGAGAAEQTSPISGTSCGDSRRVCDERRRRARGVHARAVAAIWTVRQFDEAYTAPHHGFRDAADYYHRASAMRVIDRIAVPTLILTAEDDPFVPSRRSGILLSPGIRSSRRLSRRTADTVHSSSSAPTDYDGYWAEEEVVRFVTAHAAGPSASARTPAPSLPLRA